MSCVKGSTLKVKVNPSLAEHDLANSVDPDQLASSEAN